MSRLIAIATTLLAASLLAVLLSAGSLLPDSSGLRIAEPVSMPSVHLDWNAPNLRLHGKVPDEGEHQALLRRARAIYGDANVEDGLQVATVANPAWLSPAFLPDLRPTQRARVALADAQLLIEGEVASESGRDAVVASVVPYQASGVRVTTRLKRIDPTPPPPPAAPAPAR